jgi:hypothetical protein
LYVVHGAKGTQRIRLPRAWPTVFNTVWKLRQLGWRVVVRRA